MQKIILVHGSHKTNSVSQKVANKIIELCNSRIQNLDIEQIQIDHLPFWDEGLWGVEDKKEKWDIWKAISNKLKNADGFIFISPEYGGMVPPKLSNFLLIANGTEVGHKPALAVTISASRGGAYPISQLRSFCFKNNHLCWLPSHVIIRNANLDIEVLKEGSYELDITIYCLKLLSGYAESLKSVRQLGIIDFEKFPYGM